jgi:hypothetical protein
VIEAGSDGVWQVEKSERWWLEIIKAEVEED